MSVTRAIVPLWVCAGLGLASDVSSVSTSDAVEEQGHAFTVTNTSGVSLTGMTVRSDRRPQYALRDLNFRYFYDCFLNLEQNPLGPGQSYTFHLGNDAGELHPMQISLEAAIFADGSALGDPTAVRSLWKRREWLVFEFSEVLGLIDRGIPKKDDKIELIKSLTKLKEMRLAPASMPIEEREAVIVAYDSVIGNLRLDQIGLPKDIIAAIRVREERRKSAVQSQLAPRESRLADVP